MRILWHILNGENRFSLLQRGIPDISHKMLITQLKELEQSGILHRVVVSEKPLNVTYHISNEYENLVPIIHGFCNFGTEYALSNNIHIDE